MLAGVHPCVVAPRDTLRVVKTEPGIPIPLRFLQRAVDLLPLRYADELLL